MKIILMGIGLLLTSMPSFASISCTAYDNMTNKEAKISEYKKEGIIRINSMLEGQFGSTLNAIVKIKNNKISIDGGVLDNITTQVEAELLAGQELSVAVVAGGGVGASPMLIITCNNK